MVLGVLNMDAVTRAMQRSANPNGFPTESTFAERST